MDIWYYEKKASIYEYLQTNEQNDKGWIRYCLPKDIEYTDKMLNADMRAVYVNQFNLLSGFLKTSGDLKNWHNYFYHA